MRNKGRPLRNLVNISPLGCSLAGVVLGPEASPKRAGAPKGVCDVDLTRALN